ncbi:competence/damage-inducible protein A [Cyanobacterium stanieri LEGE 03274]|uniref:CinA-like protein n=1 Tax=Cyanobacterium stanieri LEGE 03274 TaxID=1828756 RepID=A0ABR9V4H5_9CHRO|nr:competence/damage-inducible protein A [Cyanobacterium stanieri]MBE9222451.1 competence/damage-inducible protein A [Cyanobacterium stanieri LEGE 03274]
MSAEIICIGTEILLGDILNSNAQYLAQELAKLGIPHYYQTVVGDNLNRIHHVIKTALERSSILIFTGGLGPTPDDLTTEAIASYFQTKMIEDGEIIEDIKIKFAHRGREMTPNNRKQALIPQGALVLPNKTGTAPGMMWEKEDKIILTFPGVPSEMKQMWQDTAVPFLKTKGWGQEIIYSQMMRFRGIGESSLAQKVNHLFDLTNPTVAPYASHGEVKLRVSTKAKNPEEARKIIQPITEEIKAIAGQDYFGSDSDTLASVVGNILKQKGETISVAESCTGGGLGAMLTDIEGSSEYFMGGIIAYSNEVKMKLLGVSEDDLNKEGAVSAMVAEQMAIGVREKLGTDWGIGITGIAGPGGGTESKPVGLVYIGIASAKGEVFSYGDTYGSNRGRYLVRYLSACNALDKLRRML